MKTINKILKVSNVRLSAVETFVYCIILFSCTSIFAQPNSEKQKVDIKSGYIEIKPELPDAVIYTKDENGQVYIIHEGVEMWCDQAYVYRKDNFVKAYGSVRMTQGDTMTMNSTYAEYNGNTSFAFASGNVILKEPATTLTTDTLYFDRIKQQAYYRSGGKVVDTSSTLTSRIGRYFAETKKYQFLSDVKIVNPKYTVNSEQLDFYSETGGAYLYGESTIVGETSTVYCERGYYDTRGDTGYFVKNSRIDYENRILYGDSIYFDRNTSFASATNNIKVLDTLNKSVVRGHYAEVFREKDSVFITKRAVAVTLRDQDSVYVHADTLRITGKPENRILKGYYRARMFKYGAPGEQPTSGKCDSIFSSEKLGITKLLREPILWSGENQMTGDTIHLLSDKATDKLDTLKVFNNAFLVQKDSIGYNQVKGERLIGLFTNNELDTVSIKKNAEVMYFSRNDEQELIGINNTVCSYIDLYLKEQAITGIKFFKKAKGKLYPESELPPNARILKGFIWRGDERLKTVNDLFKGKPRPVLPKIKGIPLPEDEGEFFDDRPLEDIELPESSKLKPKDLQNREDDPKMKTNEDEVIEDDDGENQ
ncbi:MAG TPA: OstA-like protein [Flavobacteriaceae bacterium]|nr:OstA-like protein [Flavobacteriaceae bacterium]HIB48205.1 OstA-like protein [Flavobacteriaceae bacterium]HIN97650.1 OstA-like protein [Flavobacteriaceae bacterium]|tara:strand:- start:86399 stop:88180 length:1782 start_codon:yes stop_codon:yes gene_type:complete